MMTAKIKTPFADLLPPLSRDEFEALKASIEADGGVRVPVVVDEEGNVLDGHHRLKVDPDAKRIVMRGLSDAEKQAFVFSSNMTRRNLSGSQKKAAQKAMKAIAKDLRQQDAKKYTQAKIAATVGVARATVEGWLATKKATTNDESVNGCTPTDSPAGDETPRPDARVKINPAHKPIIAERVAT